MITLEGLDMASDARSTNGSAVEDDDVRLMAPLLADLDPEDWEDTTHWGEAEDRRQLQ